MTMKCGTMRVLLVEDNPSDALLVREALEQFGSEGLVLVHADRLAAGLEVIRDDRVDVVLLDLSLPEASGLNTLRAVHNVAPRLPIVVLSGLTDEETAIAAVNEGAQDY